MRLVVLIVALLLPGAASAQSIELTPYAGWVWGGNLKFETSSQRGEFHFDAAPHYGGSLAFMGLRNGIEVTYHYQATDLVARVDGLGEVARIDISVQYVMAQIIRQFPIGSWTPYASVGAGGAGLFAVGTHSWELAFSVGGGIARSLPTGGSLRLKARLLLLAEVSDHGFGLGAGPGVNLGSFAQGDVSIGYAIPLGGTRR